MASVRWKAVLGELQRSDDDVATVRAQLVSGEVTRDITLAYTALARAAISRVSAEAARDESSEAP
jgi:hypothetical protein